jgi:hypothetical protein
LGGSRKGSFDLVLVAAFDNDDLQPKAASRRLRTLDIISHNHWDVWIHEQGDLVEPLWSEFTGEKRSPQWHCGRDG